MPNFKAVDLSLIEDVDIKPDNDLRRSLERHGQQVPIILAQGESDAPYTIIDGKRRVATMRAMRLQIIYAEVRADVTAVEVAQTTLATNLARSRNVAAEASALRTILDANRMAAADLDTLCNETGLRKVLVRELVDLYFALSDRSYMALAVGSIPLSTAKKLARLTKERQDELFANGTTTGKDVDAALREMHAEQLIAIDDIQVPTLDESNYISGAVESFAMRLSGEDRKVLLLAAEIIRRRGSAVAA